MGLRVALRAASLAAVVALAAACAFPPQGCSRSVCDKLDISKWNEIAAADNDFKYESADSGKDEPGWDDKDGRFAQLGSYYGVYNKKYNGGVYDDKRGALRDKAPSVNYFAIRQDMGDGADTGVTISECCHACREEPNCIMYIFNPYTYRENYYVTEDGDAELLPGRSEDEDTKVAGFFPDGTGDCSFLVPKNTTTSRKEAMTAVTTVCSSSKPSDFKDDSTKPMFWGGRCNGDIKDDPHFVGARGTRFDFNGELDKSFCLVADTRVQLNAVLRGYVDPRAEKGIRSWMKELGFLWMDAQDQKHSLYLAARGGLQQERGAGFLSHVVLDGEELPVPAQQGDVISEGMLLFSFEGTRKHGPHDVDHFKLQIAGLLDISLSMRVAHPLLQQPDDAEVHFNIQFNMVQGSDKVHGVLGQTYRQTAFQLTRAIEYSLLTRVLGGPVQADGATGKGFLDGEVEDYVTSSVVESNCKFSAFGL